MEKAVDIWLKAPEGSKPAKFHERAFFKEFKSSCFHRTRGLMWKLKDGSYVIDMNHICSGKVGLFRNDGGVLSSFESDCNRKTLSFEVVDGSSIKTKVVGAFDIGEYPKFYLFSGNSFYYEERLKELLQIKGIAPYPDSKNTVDGILKFSYEMGNVKRYVGIDYVYYLDIELVSESITYDRATFGIRCHIHNVCDDRSVENIINKDKLHKALHGSKFLAKTWYLEDFVYDGGIYVMRANHVFACSGRDVFSVSSQAQFNNAVKYYASEKERAKMQTSERLQIYEVIVSEYIRDPVLWEGRKSHIRLYGIVTSEDRFFKISRFGKIMTAAKKFTLSSFQDDLIHDTHLKTTPRDLFYPGDFSRPDLFGVINSQLDELEVILAGLCNPRPYTQQADKAYMFFGLDIIIRTDGSVVLLEVNHKVGMACKDQESQEAIEFGIRVDEWKWKYIQHLF